MKKYIKRHWAPLLIVGFSGFLAGKDIENGWLYILVFALVLYMLSLLIQKKK